MDVGTWLRALGLSQYARAFAENDIDSEALGELTADDLKELGVASLGHRKKLLAAISHAPASGVQPVPPQPPPSVPPGELRQVTVLFADLSGFTKLSNERDPEEIHDILARFFEAVDGVIERYGGTIDKHIGDNVMAVFGAPVAHGNDPERVVRAACDIHEAMGKLGDQLEPPLQAHIGIASGQVMASGTGSARHQEYTVTGESVNLASRLDDIAEPEETLISEAIYRAVADLVEVEEAGEVTVAALAKPVPAWRLRALKGGKSTETRGLFVGRQAELGQFTGVIEACRETGSGKAIYIRGEAGIGKTRLVMEFQSLAKDRGFAVHTGLVLDFGVGKGQHAIGALTRGFLGIPQDSGKAIRRAHADKGLADGLVSPDQLAYLNDLLDLPQPTELRSIYDAMDPATRNRGKQATVAGLLNGIAGRQPVLVAVENVHWASALILDHLAAMTSAVTECRAVLVVTSRVEGDPLDQAWRSRTRGSGLMTIDLAPLREDEAMALAGAFIDATTHFAFRCIERAEGNPLFLEQLLRSAEERKDEDVPASIQSLVLARVDRLPPGDKKALQAAAVIGQRFSLDPLKQLLDEPDYRCTGLIEHYLVRPEGEDYLFAHAMIQEAVYSSLLKPQKSQLHRSAAEWFADSEPTLRGEHLDRAEDSAAPQAYLEAAKKEASAYRYAGARDLLERGLDLAGDRADRYALTSFQADLLRKLGDPKDSITAFRRALEFTDSEVGKCQAWIGVAAGVRLLGGYDEGIDALGQAETVARSHELNLELSQIHFYRGCLLFASANIDDCLEEHARALEHAGRVGDPEWEARALSGLGDAHYAHGRMSSALDHYRRCHTLSLEHGLGRIEVANRYMLGVTRRYLNEFHAALDDLFAAIDMAVKVGNRRAEMYARMLAGEFLIDRREPAQAKAQLAEAREIAETVGNQRFKAYVMNQQARCLLQEDRRVEAEKTLAEAIAISRQTGVTFIGPRLLGTTAIALSDPSIREKVLAEGEEIVHTGCNAHNNLWFYRDAMEATLSVGDWDGVERYAAVLEDYTRPEPLTLVGFLHRQGSRARRPRQRQARRRDDAGASAAARRS